MQGEKFTLMQYNVNAILGFIEAGQFVIPEIQRPFVWKRAQVRDLIDSLYNGYPTGYIITWKNPDVKTKDGTVANGKHVLIDGQQRITALMASIAGLEVLDEDFNKDRVKIAFNPLATDSDKRFAVQDASHLKDKKWIPDISEVFKNDFDPFEFVPKYCNNNLGVKPNEVNNAIMKLRGIANRQIGVIELDHSLDIDEVTEIFPKAYLKNNGIDTKGRYNQVANFTYLDTQVNKAISDDAPNIYFQSALEQCDKKNIAFGNIFERDALMKNLSENAIPESIVSMTVENYDDFLADRRKLMAKLMMRYYKGL